MDNLILLSLGSNVGDREANLREAITRLGKVGRVLAVSSFYETEPVEFTDQAWFLNCAVALETPQSAAGVMKAALAIERGMGRERNLEKGPRTIDIDLLLAGSAVIESAVATVPHPAMHRRRFVLEPLAEIAPGARHPILQKTVLEMLSELPPGQTVRRRN